jgi:hypothetical protein
LTDGFANRAASLPRSRERIRRYWAAAGIWSYWVGSLHEFVGWFLGRAPLDHLPSANITIDAAAVSNGQFGIAHEILRLAVPTDRRQGRHGVAARLNSLGEALAAFPRSRHAQACDRGQRGQGCAAPVGLDLDASARRGRKIRVVERRFKGPWRPGPCLAFIFISAMGSEPSPMPSASNWPVPTQNSECRRKCRVYLAFGVLSRDNGQLTQCERVTRSRRPRVIAS